MSEKRTRRSYDREFKQQAVNMVVVEGRSRAEVGRNLGLGEGLIGRWVKEFASAGSGAFPGKGQMTGQDQEIRKLAEELRRVTMERDILRKATAYFAQLSK